MLSVILDENVVEITAKEFRDFIERRLKYSETSASSANKSLTDSAPTFDASGSANSTHPKLSVVINDLHPMSDAEVPTHITNNHNSHDSHPPILNSAGASNSATRSATAGLSRIQQNSLKEDPPACVTNRRRCGLCQVMGEGKAEEQAHMNASHAGQSYATVECPKLYCTRRFTGLYRVREMLSHNRKCYPPSVGQKRDWDMDDVNAEGAAMKKSKAGHGGVALVARFVSATHGRKRAASIRVPKIRRFSL